MIALGCGLLVLVDAPRRILSRIRPPRYAVTPPIQAQRHVIAASFRRRTVGAPVTAPPVAVAAPEPDGLWLAGPGPWS